MARNAGGKLRPEQREKQGKKRRRDEPILRVLSVLQRKGLIATQESFKRVLRWMQFGATGSQVDYRTIFFARRSGKNGRLEYRPREEIVSMFDEVYKSAADTGAYGGHLHQIELEERAGIGPISPFLPWEKDGPQKAKAIFRDKPQLPGFDVNAYNRALERFAALVETQSCSIDSLDVAVRGTGNGEDGMDTSTNSGTPFWIRRWKPAETNGSVRLFDPKDEERRVAFNWIMNRAEELRALFSESRATNEIPLWYATAGQRLVAKGPKPFSPKSKRLVIAYPKEEAVLGNTWAPNVMNKLRAAVMPSGNRIMAAWFNLPVVDSNAQVILEDANNQGLIVNSGDISAFDATVPPWLLMDVGRVIASWVRGGQHLVENMFKAMVYRTVLITPGGFYGPGPSSMKSGSVVTNLGGSCSNIVIQFYGEELGLYSLRSLAVLGDDFLAAGPGVNPETTERTFASFGMEANQKKQFYQKDALQFLKRLHYRGIPGGIASAYRTLGSCLSLERLAEKPSEWSQWAYVVQALSKLSNLSFNPLITETVSFLAEGDRLQLGRDMSPQAVVASSGDAGTRILAEDSRKSWKQMGDGVKFENWLVNGVLRGEVAPPVGRERFKRVYGTDFTLSA